ARSVSLGTPPTPKMTAEGARSPWTTPSSCAWSMPVASTRRIATASAGSGSGPEASRSDRRSTGPSSASPQSVTTYGTPSWARPRPAPQRPPEANRVGGIGPQQRQQPDEDRAPGAHVPAAVDHAEDVAPDDLVELVPTDDADDIDGHGHRCSRSPVTVALLHP